MIREEDKQNLLSKINIVDLISEYVDLTKSGSGYKGFSPFKAEKTPSFMVSPDKKIFKDFSTNQGGDAIKFYMLINKKTYVEAIEELAKKYNVSIKGIVKTSNANIKKYEIMRKACEFYHKELLKNEQALEYLKQRSYTIKDIEKFKLGYASKNWQDLYKHLITDYNEEDLIDLGLIAKNNDNIYDIFRNRIMIPIFNEKMNIIAFGGRDLSFSKDVAKYLNSKESKIFVKSNELFGIYDGGQKIKDYSSCILVEGFFDVLSLQKNDIANVISSLGTSLTKNQAKYIRSLTENIVIAYDEDGAGTEAKIRAINILNEYGFNIKILSLDNMAKDPDEFLLKYGRDEFVEKYKKSQDAIEFLIKHYTKDLDIDKLASKTMLINKLKTYFASMTNRIYFDNSLEILSKYINIRKDILEEQIKFSIKKEKNENKGHINYDENIRLKTRDKKKELEEISIKCLLLNKKYAEIFKNFNFNDIYLESILKKVLENKENEYTEDEANIVFDIQTKYDDTLLNNINIIIREWVLLETEYILEMLKMYGNSIEKMSREDYTKYISLIKKQKLISKSINMNEIMEVLKDFKEYEKGKLYVYREQEEKK